jgi:hypothetical protein
MNLCPVWPLPPIFYTSSAIVFVCCNICNCDGPPDPGPAFIQSVLNPQARTRWATIQVADGNLTIFCKLVHPTKSGWWIGTCCIFPNSLDGDPYFSGGLKPPIRHGYLTPMIFQTDLSMFWTHRKKNTYTTSIYIQESVHYKATCTAKPKFSRKKKHGFRWSCSPHLNQSIESSILMSSLITTIIPT